MLALQMSTCLSCTTFCSVPADFSGATSCTTGDRAAVAHSHLMSPENEAVQTHADLMCFADHVCADDVLGGVNAAGRHT